MDRPFGNDETNPDPAPIGGSRPRGEAPTRPDLVDFELLQPIGDGAFGVVWIARNRHTNRFVAVKVLTAHQDIELAAIRAFLQTVSNHPHLVPIEHVGMAEERLYVVMPLADNAASGSPLLDPRDYRPLSLDVQLARVEKMSPEEIARIGADLASALEHMHRHGALHGDVKPTNVLRFDGAWRLADFSLVVFPEERRRRGYTEGYSPPDGVVGPGADLYALGVTLFQCTGRNSWELGNILREGPAGASAQERDLLRVIASLCGKPETDNPIDAACARELFRDIAGDTPTADPVRWITLLARRLAPVVPVVLIALLATLLAGAVARPLFSKWTPLNDAYWSWLRGVGTAAVGPTFENLDEFVIVAMRDTTPLDDLAQEAGLEGVSSRNLRSLRRLHGELCRRLAVAGPASVVWDIYFSVESEFDADLASGIDALQANGVGVVVTSYRWRGESGDAPPIAPLIWNTGARWGSNHVQLDQSGAIWVPLVTSLQGGGSLPSLVLAAHAASRRSDAWFDVEIDYASNEALCRYWRPLGDRPDRRVYLGAEDRVPLTVVQPFTPGPTRGRDPGLRAGDTLGYIHALPASPEALERATVDYEEIFRAGPDELHRRLRDRIVVIGDFRAAAGDVVNVPGHGRIAGPHLVASAIAQVRSQAVSRVPAPLVWRSGVVLFAAAASCCTIVAFRKVRTGRTRTAATMSVALLALLLAPALIGVVSYRHSGVLSSPFPAMLAVLLAVTFTAALVARPTARRAAGRTEGVLT